MTVKHCLCNTNVFFLSDIEALFTAIGLVLFIEDETVVIQKFITVLMCM